MSGPDPVPASGSPSGSGSGASQTDDAPPHGSVSPTGVPPANSGSAATVKTNVAKTKPQVSRGYLDAPVSAKIKELDVVVRNDIDQVKDDNRRALDWWQKFGNYFDPKTGKFSNPETGNKDDLTLQWTFRRQDEDIEAHLNTLNEDLKKDIRARLGATGFRPNFEKDVRKTAAAMSKEFGIGESVVERAATEVINETYKPFDDDVRRTFAERFAIIEKGASLTRKFMDNKISEKEKQAVGVGLSQNSGEEMLASKIYYRAVTAAVDSRIKGCGLDVAHLTSKTKEYLSDAVFDATVFPYVDELYVMDLALFVIKSQGLKTEEAARAIIQKVALKNYSSLDRLIDFYPSNNDKLADEIRKNSGYQKIIKEFLVRYVFDHYPGQLPKVDEVMTRLSLTTDDYVKVEPDIVRDIMRAAEKYANEIGITLPADEIADLIKKIDKEVFERANEGML